MNDLLKVALPPGMSCEEAQRLICGMDSVSMAANAGLVTYVDMINGTSVIIGCKVLVSGEPRAETAKAIEAIASPSSERCAFQHINVCMTW